MPLDFQKLAKQLEDAGVPHFQAQTHAAMLEDIVRANGAEVFKVKSEIQSDLSRLELTLWKCALVGMYVIQALIIYLILTY